MGDIIEETTAQQYQGISHSTLDEYREQQLYFSMIVFEYEI